MARLALALVMAVALWGVATCQRSEQPVVDVPTVVTSVVSTVADRLANGALHSQQLLGAPAMLLSPAMQQLSTIPAALP